jgi:hypothetical protein
VRDEGNNPSDIQKISLLCPQSESCLFVVEFYSFTASLDTREDEFSSLTGLVYDYRYLVSHFLSLVRAVRNDNHGATRRAKHATVSAYRSLNVFYVEAANRSTSRADFTQLV